MRYVQLSSKITNCKWDDRLKKWYVYFHLHESESVCGESGRRRARQSEKDGEEDG